MRKTVIKLLALMLIAVSFMGFEITAFAADTFIDDFAGYLTDDEKIALEQKAKDVSEETGFNVDIVLTDDINGKDPMDYADDIYDQRFGINTNGFLVLINNDTYEDWISTSGDAILYYSDSRIDSIHEASKRYLKDEQYYEAVDTYLDSFSSYYNDGIPDSNESYKVNFATGELIKRMDFTVPILIGLLTAVICIVIIVRRYKFHQITSANTYLDRNETAFHVKTDNFIREYTTSHRIQTGNNSSGGFGGGSSTHMSSGGGTHGGGGSHR